jgi:hypothetical protein
MKMTPTLEMIAEAILNAWSVRHAGEGDDTPSMADLETAAQSPGEFPKLAKMHGDLMAEANAVLALFPAPRA